MREHTVALAKALNVVGLINVQYAIKDGKVYVLEVNPRGSRTVPFVSKAIGVPLAAIAARVMLGETLEDIGFTEEVAPAYISVKEAVFPFNKFREFDPILGPSRIGVGDLVPQGIEVGDTVVVGASGRPARPRRAPGACRPPPAARPGSPRPRSKCGDAGAHLTGHEVDPLRRPKSGRCRRRPGGRTRPRRRARRGRPSLRLGGSIGRLVLPAVAPDKGVV